MLADIPAGSMFYVRDDDFPIVYFKHEDGSVSNDWGEVMTPEEAKKNFFGAALIITDLNREY